jgi:predicted transcriptional regulator
MSDKETVIEAVRELPEHVTFSEILDHLAMVEAIRRGKQDADAGKLLPHEDVKKRVASWISK